MERLGPRVGVRAVEPLEGFVVRVKFADGAQRDIDLEPYLRGAVFESIRKDPFLFRSVKVQGGALAWDNGADIDPDVLYYNLKPAWMEEHEPAR